MALAFRNLQQACRLVVQAQFILRLLMAQNRSHDTGSRLGAEFFVTRSLRSLVH